MTLTYKQQKFCENIALRGMNQSEAYRDAYDCKNMKDDTIKNNASKLARNSYVATTIKELTAKLETKTIKEFAITKAKLLQELEQIKRETIHTENNKIAIDCIKEQGRMSGFYEDNLNVKGNLDLHKSLSLFKARLSKKQ